MTRLVFFSIVFFSIFQLQGQTIQVMETDSEFPIDRVLIYNKTKKKFLYTDKNGKADLSRFSNSDILFFQHLSYIKKSFKKADIKAQDKIIYLHNDAEQIQEVVLSASRGKEKRARIAEHIEVITKYKIEQQSPQTSADLLAATPGVKVQKSQFGGGSPILRGMESNRVLLVIDGVRMNNAIYRKGHLQNSITVSPNVLSRTEVLFGPSSIIYGSDALGGVIHYYTKSPSLHDKTLFSSSVFGRYSSVNNEISASYSSEFSSKRWASLTVISANKFGDLKMGENRRHGFDSWGLVPYYSSNTSDIYEAAPKENPDKNRQINTGYKQIDLLQKFLFQLDKNTDLNLNIQYSNSTDIPRFDKLNEYNDGTLKYAEWHYGPQKRLLISSQLAINPKRKWMKDGQITLAYQDINESRIERKFGSLNRFVRKENVKVMSLTGDFHVPLTPDEKRILSYGFETSYNDVVSKAMGKTIAVNGPNINGYTENFNIQSRYPDGGSSYTNFALYSNYRFDHSKKGTLNVGIRFTNTLLKAKWEDNNFVTLPDMAVSLNNSAVSGTLGYVYKPTKSWQINTVLSSGFRSPNIDDVGKIREKRGTVSVPNTNLKPEHAYNAEIGIMHFTKEKRSFFGLNLYYMYLHNYITRDLFTYNGEEQILYDGELATTIANVNKGDAYVSGATLSFRSKLNEHFTLASSATHTQGHAYDSNEPLSSIPPLFGNARLSYTMKKWNFGLDFRFNAKKSSSDYNITEGIDNIEETPIIDSDATNATEKYFGSPSWHTFNFSSRFKLKRNISMRLHVDNLFDVHYKEFASGVSAPGRNFSFSVHADF